MIRLVRPALEMRRRARAALSAVMLLASVWAAACSAALAGDSPAIAQAAGSHSAAPCRVFRVRPQDQVWAVSTRCLGCPFAAAAEPAWSVWKYEAAAPRWRTASSAEFYATDSADIVTAFYLHGNQIDGSQALSDGLTVYFELAGKFDGERPVRFVIWSWPSDKIRGPLRDARSKADRSDIEAYYLARFLRPMRPEVKTGVIGYSLGARIIAGSLHLLNGGQLIGYTLGAGNRPAVRVAFWAAAEHDDWLLPGRVHGRAIDAAEHWLITRNYCDPVLSLYRFIDRCKPAAMGYSGLVGRNLFTAEQNSRIEELDVTNIVGRSHDYEPYLYSPSILNRTREVLLWHGAERTFGERRASGAVPVTAE